MEKQGCRDCAMRAKHDKNPRSIIGRIWRWHINFCPGWKAYLKGLSSEERSDVEKKYSLARRG